MATVQLPKQMQQEISAEIGGLLRDIEGALDKSPWEFALVCGLTPREMEDTLSRSRKDLTPESYAEANSFLGQYKQTVTDFATRAKERHPFIDVAKQVDVYLDAPVFSKDHFEYSF